MPADWFFGQPEYSASNLGIGRFQETIALRMVQS